MFLQVFKRSQRPAGKLGTSWQLPNKRMFTLVSGGVFSLIAMIDAGHQLLNITECGWEVSRIL